MYDCNIYGSEYLQACSDFDAAFKDTVQGSTIALITSSALVAGTIGKVDGDLSQQYGCYSDVPKCSYFELVAMQWNTLAITSNPPTLIKAAFTPATSIKDWFPTYLPHAFEWGYYVQTF